MQVKTVAFYCQTNSLKDCGRWTLRFAEKYLNAHVEIVGRPISSSTIQRILKKQNLKPHLSKYYLHITDPNFFPKMEKIISLYLNQPEYLFSFDECPGIQILQRIAPDIKSEYDNKRLEEFEYSRNGTIDVFAFFRISSGEVFAECKSDHKKDTLAMVFENHLKTLPSEEPLHYVMDNLASHSCYLICQLVAKYSNIECPSKVKLATASARREWLQQENKRIIFHYTPFHGSWLNLVEIWFGILNQKCLKESYKSPDAFRDNIFSFLETWNTLLLHPFKWKYTGEGLHLKTIDKFIAMLESGLEKMTIQFITKQFLLMTNIFENYFEKVGKEPFSHLNKLIAEKYELLLQIINNEKGPQVKEKANNALKNLRDVLRECDHEIIENRA